MISMISIGVFLKGGSQDLTSPRPSFNFNGIFFWGYPLTETEGSKDLPGRSEVWTMWRILAIHWIFLSSWVISMAAKWWVFDGRKLRLLVVSGLGNGWKVEWFCFPGFSRVPLLIFWLIVQLMSLCMVNKYPSTEDRTRTTPWQKRCRFAGWLWHFFEKTPPKSPLGMKTSWSPHVMSAYGPTFWGEIQLRLRPTEPWRQGTSSWSSGRCQSPRINHPRTGEISSPNVLMIHRVI